MSFVKKPCKHCPFRVDVTPFLHPARAMDIAYISENPYSSFTCHNTLESNDDGESVIGGNSLECAGMLTMRAQYLGEESLPEGFDPSYRMCYVDPLEMYQAYEEEWNKKRGNS